MIQDPNNLPVPCDAIVQGNWINEPFKTAIPAPPSAQEAAIFLQALAANMVTLLQQNARNGHVSCFAYNLFSMNGYNNEYWLAILSDAYDLAVKIQTCHQQASQDQVLALAIRKFHPYVVGNCVNHFPILQQLIDMQQVNNAFAAVNAFRTEAQQLSVQYENLLRSQSSGGSLLNSLGGMANLAAANTAGSASLIGALSGNYGTSIIQEDTGPVVGWGRQRARPAGSPPIEKPVQGETLRVQPAPVVEPAQITSAISGGVEMPLASMSLTPPRRARAARAAQPTEPVAAEEPKVIHDLPEPVVKDPVLEETNDPLTAIDIGLPVASQPEKPRPVNEAAREMHRHSKYPLRTMLVPLVLQELPDTLEEAIDAANAADRIHGVERLDGVTMELMVLDESNGTAEHPFGNYISDQGHLVTVVRASTSGWKVSEDQKIRVSYNPFKWHRALVQRMTSENELYGPVVEGFIPIEEEDPMDLLDLEFDPAERAKAINKLNNGKVYIPVKGEILEIEPVERQLLLIGSNPSLEKKDERTAEEARNRDNIKAAHFQAARGKRRDPVSVCVELQHLVLNGGGNYVAATIPASSGFRLRHALKGKVLTVTPLAIQPVRYLTEQLNELMITVPSLAKKLDRLMAQDINNLLEYSFGYDEIEITSFINGWADLVDHMLEVYSDEIVDIFTKAVNSKLSRWHIEDTGDEIVADGDCFCVVTCSPIEDLGVQMLGDGYGFISLTLNPNLVTIMEKGKAQKNNEMKDPDMFFMGRDGDLWQAFSSVFDPTVNILVRV